MSRICHSGAFGGSIPGEAEVHGSRLGMCQSRVLDPNSQVDGPFLFPCNAR